MQAVVQRQQEDAAAAMDDYLPAAETSTATERALEREELDRIREELEEERQKIAQSALEVSKSRSKLEVWALLSL
jgi:hypothetical protein